MVAAVLAAVVLSCGMFEGAPMPAAAGKSRAETPRRAYERVLSDARAKMAARKAFDLGALLASTGQPVPRACAQRAAVIRRVETSAALKRPSWVTRPIPPVALLFVQTPAYRYCACPGRCRPQGPEPVQCALALVSLPGGRERLLVAAPKLALHADLAKLRFTWSFGPAGVMLVTAHHRTDTRRCGVPPGKPHRTRDIATLIGVYQGRLQEYLSLHAAELIQGPGIWARTQAEPAWVPKEFSRADVLEVVTRGYKDEISKNQDSGEHRREVSCFLSSSHYLLDPRTKQLRLLKRRAARRLLRPPANRISDRTADSRARCERLLDWELPREPHD